MLGKKISRRILKEIIEYRNTNISTENTFFKLYVNSSQPKHKTIPPTKTKSLEKQ